MKMDRKIFLKMIERFLTYSTHGYCYRMVWIDWLYARQFVLEWECFLSLKSLGLF